MNAYEMDDFPTIYAAESESEAISAYTDDTGEQPESGYPRKLSDAELDAEFPELDENEAQTGNLTSMRQMLAAAAEPGFLCAPSY